MTKLSIPCQWHEETLSDILHIRSNCGVTVDEVYGTISSEALPHGRISSVVEKVAKEKALSLKKMLDERNIHFAYLLNAPLYLKSYEEIKSDLDWIIGVFHPDSFTITSLELMEFMRKNYADVRINVSTIAGIKEVADIKKFEHIEPAKVILHHDANRNFAELQNIISYCKANGITVEIMLNESCIRRCRKRDEHYCSIAKGQDDHNFHIWCNSQKLVDPYQLLLANFILPHEVAYYEELGVDYFKVTGRSKPLGWLQEVVNAYLQREYQGNMLRLAAIDPQLEAEQWIYVDSCGLQDFLANFPKSGNSEEEVEYCKAQITELYKNGGFYVKSDVVEYSCEKGYLEGKLRGDFYKR